MGATHLQFEVLMGLLVHSSSIYTLSQWASQREFKCFHTDMLLQFDQLGYRKGHVAIKRHRLWYDPY